MKYAWIIALVISTAALAKLNLPADGVGTCYFGPNCQGPVINQGVTQETCAHSGGHSLRIRQACESF